MNPMATRALAAAFPAAVRQVFPRPVFEGIRPLAAAFGALPEPAMAAGDA